MANLDFALLIHVLIEHELRLQHNSKKKHLRNVADPMSIPEGIFKQIYRFNKNTARYLINEISPFLPDPEREEISIPKEQTILCALHFYAQGSYQKSIGQDLNFPMSQAAVSRSINLVTDILNNHFHHKIKFPVTDREKNQEKIKFMQLPSGFPGIIGCIDCTQIAIQAPPTDDEQFPGILFYNRKGFYSLNTQIICNSDLKILGINSRYPGSVHDSAIWATSEIRQHLIQNFNNGDRASWLIGDSGYPTEPWLMNPIGGHNHNEMERRYNVAIKSVRNVIERLNGVFKARFRCCFGHRTLHYGPVKAAKIINACAILHNIFIEQRDFIDDEIEANGDNNDININNPNVNNINRHWLAEGRIIRQRILNDYF